MKKFIIPILVFAVFAFAGDWLYDTIEHATGSTFSFDGDSADYVGKYSNTYDVGRGNKLPQYLYITSFLTPDTGTAAATQDTIQFYIRLDYSNDQSNWYSDVTIDTVTVDSAEISDGAVIANYIRWEPLGFRYFRLYLSTYMDTANTSTEFNVSLQKSVEME